MSSIYSEVTATYSRDRVLEKFDTTLNTLPYTLDDIKISHNDLLLANVYNDTITKLYFNYLFLIANAEITTKTSPTTALSSYNFTDTYTANADLATTATSGTNTTQEATTAFVTTAVAALDTAAINTIVYPVGSIYTNIAVATNPASLLGMGTWVAFGEGRVLVGKAGSGTFDTLGATGGAETDAHTLTIAEMPAHTHGTVGSTSGVYGNGGAWNSSGGGGTTASTGGGAAHTHDILQPYIVVYMWKRTA